MATWIAHLRIAEYFMANNKNLDSIEFLVGNIAPDSSVPNEDWSKFDPDANITHWQTDDDKSTINADDFKQSYLQTKDEKYPFYFGYYLHLLTDIEWNKLFNRKRQEPIYAEGLNADKDFIWTIKKDWYGQDRVYLQEHKESVFFTKFAKIEAFPNIYLDYFPDIAFTQKVKYITEYYLQGIKDENPNRDFPFLSKAEMNDFVNNTIQVFSDSCCELINRMS